MTASDFSVLLPPADWLMNEEFRGSWIQGDGKLVYHGVDADGKPLPIMSMRGANLRDSMEDREYLHLLQGLTDERVTRKLVEPVATGVYTFSRDVEQYYTVRDRVASLIEWMQ